mgnify:CR=1 FL=1
MPRTEVNDFLQKLQDGTRISVRWRFGATTEEDATEVVTWTGKVVEIEKDTDGRTRATVHYDADCVGFEGGGHTSFPPPSLSNAKGPVEILSAEARMPRKFPNLTAFKQPPPGNVAIATTGESEPLTSKRPRDEAEAIADALRGDMAKTRIADGLKVPTEIPARFAAFYPHLWVGGNPAEWIAKFNDTMQKLGTNMHGSLKRGELYEARDNFAGWMEITQHVKPTTKEEWLLPFNLAFRLLALCAVSQQGYKGETQVRSETRAAFETGYVNVATIYKAIEKSEVAVDTVTSPKNERQTGGFFRGRGRGRGQAFRGRVK